MNCKSHSKFASGISNLSREGAEWLHNRRILNRLLLNGNLNWMDVHIENCTRQLVDRWQTNTEQTAADEKHYELPDLERQLYRWSIEGEVRKQFIRQLIANQS